MSSKVDYFILAAAVVSLGLSVFLWIEGKQESAIFVGLWVPSMLGFGNYLKLKSTER